MKKVLILLAAAALSLGAHAQELANFARQGQGQQIVSPEVQDGKVTFRLAANYKFTDWLSGAAFYSYEKVDTDKMVGTKFDENVFGLSATLKY